MVIEFQLQACVYGVVVRRRMTELGPTDCPVHQHEVHCFVSVHTIVPIVIWPLLLVGLRGGGTMDCPVNETKEAIEEVIRHDLSKTRSHMSLLIMGRQGNARGF